METYFDNLPEKIKKHLEKLVQSPDDREQLAEIWKLKENMFLEQTSILEMIEVSSLDKTSEHGILMLTFSGSLISNSTPTNGFRRFEYASIKERTEVPDIIVSEKASLESDVAVNKGVEFSGAPVKTTSAIYKIMTFTENISKEEQDKRIREAMIFLTNGFVKLNTSLIKGAKPVDQFTLKSMVSFIAKKNNMTQKQVRLIIDDYLSMLETGMLLGAKVPIGTIGKLHLNLRPAQKARIGRNPATGEEMTIKAKPNMYIPKTSFSKSFKDKAARVEVTNEDQ